MPARLINDVETAVTELGAGRLVAIPTETVYGLAGNALNESAVAGIFTAKGRPSFDPLIIHQSSAERVLQYAAEIPAGARSLGNAFWPGPLTMVLPKVPEVPDLVSAGLPTVAMRVPNHPLTLELLKRLDFPLAAPSANPFGFVSPTTAEHVAEQLGDKIDTILDGGPCQIGLESTIVGFPGGEATIYRKGGLAVEDIERVLGRPVVVREHGNSRPEAPGMLSRHYSPGVPMELFDRIENATALPKYSAMVLFGRGGKEFGRLEDHDMDVYDLSPSANLSEAASNLFRVLRELNKKAYRCVAIETVPESGLGRAINDRLRRAAATE